MTTPRNSVSGTFPIESTRGPLAMQASQKRNLRRPSSLVGPTQSFFMRESKALGAVQIMNGLFHISLGGLLMIPTGVFAPICMSVWYPLWGGIMDHSWQQQQSKPPEKVWQVKAKVIMNSLSLFAAISGIILSIMDILNITVSHFLKMERLILSKTPNLYVDIYNCEPSNSSEKNSPSTQYCYSMQSVFLGILSVMLISAFFQKLVTAGVVENDWRRMCSRPKSDIMTSSQTTTYPGMHVTIPNPYPPTSSMAHHPQQPLGILNVGNQVQTGQLPFITSPGIFTTNRFGPENVPTVHPAPVTTTTKANFKDEAIALGAVHIIIGLMHIGFGVVLGLLNSYYYVSWAFYSIAFIGGYPFWGGVSVKSTLTMNIISAVFAFVGVILFVVDLNINGYHYQNYWMVLSGRGIAGMLAIFSVLEFGVACAMTHFANQTRMHGSNRSVPTAPSMYVVDSLMQESFPDSRRYDNIPAYAPRQ
ncbi:B-lymphocyte antigen CD20-like protein [Cricetulus griseus]|nr:B-lymphocyte antigen CD20-like protein [Cricetulus griseus]